MSKLFLLIILGVIIINLPPTKSLIGQEDVLYSNANGSFTYDEVNYTGRNLNLCLENFEAFKGIYKTDTILFRVTPINILKFWQWGNYLINQKYRLPYKSWKDIETIRGPIKNRSQWQAF